MWTLPTFWWKVIKSWTCMIFAPSFVSSYTCSIGFPQFDSSTLHPSNLNTLLSTAHRNIVCFFHTARVEIPTIINLSLGSGIWAHQWRGRNERDAVVPLRNILTPQGVRWEEDSIDRRPWSLAPIDAIATRNTFNCQVWMHRLCDTFSTLYTDAKSAFASSETNAENLVSN